MILWSKYPFIRLLVPLATGIIICHFSASYISLPVIVPAAIILLLLAILPLLGKRIPYAQRWITGVLLNAAIISLGYSLTSYTFLKNQPRHFANAHIEPDAYVARVTGEPENKNNVHKLNLQIEALSYKGNLKTVSGNCICYIHQNDTLNTVSIPKYADVITFSAKPEFLKPPQNPGEFNYKGYLENQGFFHSLRLEPEDFKILGREDGIVEKRLYATSLQLYFKSFALSIRNKLLRIISNAGITGDEFAIAAALLTGYEEKIEPELINSYSAAGVIHLLSVSGLHVGIVFLLADFMFRLFRRWNKFSLVRPVTIITIVWVYAFITGMASPVIRASIMFTFITLGSTFHRQNNTINFLTAAAFLILIFDPRALFNVGFQLSFSAVAGILIFQPSLKNLWNPVNPVLKHIRDLLTISMAAQIITTPFVLYYFHRFPTYFLISNILAIPLSGLIMYTGVFLLLTSWMPFLGNIIGTILSVQIRFLNWFVRYIENIPGAVIDNIHLSLLSGVVLMCLLISALLFFKHRIKLYALVASGCLGVLIICSSLREYTISKQHKIIFHKVADGTLISLIEGRKHVVIYDSVLSINRSLLDYKLNGLRAEAGLNEPSETLLRKPLKDNYNRTLQFPEFYSFLGKRIVIINSSSYLPGAGKRLKVDYVFLCDYPVYSIKQLKDNFPGALFILGNSLARWEHCKIRKDARVVGVQMYSLYESGALVIDLES